MIISRYVIEFFIFSVIGWLFECTYCTVKEHRWQNRGFLFGPVVPIYGAGAVIASVISHYAPPVAALPDWQLFLLCAVVSAVLEYVTSYFLEKQFHARWWDYRDMPLNLNGRICLPATIGFGLAGLVIIRVILPRAGSYEAALPPLVTEALALAITALISADTAITCVTLTSLLEKLEHFDEEFNKTVESAYARVEAAPAAITDRIQEQGAAMRQSLQDKQQEMKLSLQDKQQGLQLRVKSLTARQTHILMNIRRINSEKANAAADRMRSAVRAIKDRRS